jgi:hypothetical protein
MDEIDLARRIAFALSKAVAVTLGAHTNAQMLESTAPVCNDRRGFRPNAGSPPL